MASLVTHIRNTVDPKQYYSSKFPELSWPGSSSEARINCIFHEDKKTPSLSLNPVSGAWFCHGCEVGGKSIVSFHAALNDQTHNEAAREIFHEHIHPTIEDKAIRRWARKLKGTPTALRYVHKARFVSKSIMQRYEIGWTGNKFTIPIRNEFNICINAKLHDPTATKTGLPKMLNYSKDDESRSFGSPSMLFPLQVMAQDVEQLVICEGEWDTLALLSIGIPSVTTTAGSKSWPSQYNEMFRGFHVVIAYDNDKDGNKYDKRVMQNLLSIAKSIRRLRIPKKYGKDVTHWIKAKPMMRRKRAWTRVLNRAKVLVDNPDVSSSAQQVVQVPLAQASKAQWHHKRIRVDALVTGKDTAPYLLPRKYRVFCNQSCDTCPLTESDKGFKEVEIKPTNPLILKMIDASDKVNKKIMFAAAGMDPDVHCRARIETVESFNLEQLLLIPTLDSSDGQYVMRSSYYVGHGLIANRAYRFEGVTTAHPKDQHTTHLFDVSKPVQDEIETFELTDQLKRDLQKFRPKKLKLLAHLMSFAEWQSRNVTKIRERPDMHIAVDIVFHSLRSFLFNNESVHRGMLDILILGDTRCGKGYVTEGLARYYGLGEVASGENCTFAGLVGGLHQVGNRWLISWGVIPLNNNRLVVIDETSSLNENEIGHMSRVRSEGVAEISKIIREVTQANTRLIWVSNPRSGQSIMSYNTGIEAIKELMGANEDVSRFDFAMTVATNEVPSEIINAPADYDTTDNTRYPRELCRALILWAWSRTPEQVQFTKGATSTIIREAIKFGRSYSPNIPLVQAENIRIKLAKISAAIAARTFSTDESFENVVIMSKHVRCACEFLRILYAKTSMNYNGFSRAAIAASTITKPENIEEVLRNTRNFQDTVAGLLEMHKISTDSLADHVGDGMIAKTVIGDLVRLRCLSRTEKGNWYTKNPAFSTWLRQKRRRKK